MARRASFRPFRVATAALVAAACLDAGPRPVAQVLDRVRAVVNGQVVTELDVRAAAAFRLVDPTAAGGEAGILERLVERELMLAEVDRYAAREPEEPLVAARMAAILRRFATPDQRGEAERRTGMTEERLRQFVRDELRIEGFIDQRFTAAAQPTEDEITRYYREHRQDLGEGTKPPPSLDTVRPEVIARATAQRRAALVAEWLDRLRQRADISILNRDAS